MKKIVLAVAVVLLFAIAVGLGLVWDRGSNDFDKADLRKVSLRLAWVPDMAEAGIFIAKEKGYYADEGLDLEIKQGGFGLDPFKLVASGTDTFGVGGAGNLLLAREQGVPVIAIAAEFQDTPVGFIVKVDSGIRNVKQFTGKRVGVQTGADTDVLYRALLSYNDMESSDVKEIPIQYDMKPFLADQIDILPGYVTNQPITLKNQGIDTHVITAASEGVNMYGNIYFVTEETMRTKAEVVDRFNRATLKGWGFFFTNKSEAVEIVGKYVEGFTETDLNKIYEAVGKFIRPDNNTTLLKMTLQRWESTYDVLKRAKMSDHEISIVEAFRLPFHNERQ